MIRRGGLLALALGLAQVASADAPVDSPRPVERPVSVAVRTAVAAAMTQPARFSAAAVRLSPRPQTRPENLRRKTIVRATGMAQSTPKVVARGNGLCGFADVSGERLSPIPGRIKGCGLAEPVRVRAVSGVALSQAAVMDCTTLGALRNWVNNGMRPAMGGLGGGVVRLEVAAHYACRTRNNQPGAKISEHGRGRAIDISGFTLKNGQTLTVLKGWGGSHGKRLRQMHRAACGPFGTVLGPNANRFHTDHFHFDTARYRSGTYCR